MYFIYAGCLRHPILSNTPFSYRASSDSVKRDRDAFFTFGLPGIAHWQNLESPTIVLAWKQITRRWSSIWRRYQPFWHCCSQLYRWPPSCTDTSPENVSRIRLIRWLDLRSNLSTSNSANVDSLWGWWNYFMTQEGVKVEKAMKSVYLKAKE